MLERHPRRIAAAAFLQTKPTADDESARAKRTALVEKVKAGHPEAVADTFTDLIFAQGTLQQRPDLVRQVRQWMLDTPPAGLAGALIAMRERRDYSADLEQIAVPSLVVGGEQDRAIPVDAIKAFAAALPRSTSCLIAEAGHMANLERPEEFNRCLLDFLQGRGSELE
jgi:pimeloyl-ACP methyl ester carboxylesterase